MKYLSLGLVFFGLACSDDSDNRDFAVGLVPFTGQIDDNTFNQAAYEGARRANQELGIQIDFSRATESDKIAEKIQSYVDLKFDLIITVGFPLQDVTLQKAGENATSKMAIVDVAIADAPANLTSIAFRGDQAGYLAGVLAAKITASKVVGALCGMEIPPVKAFCNGFSQGVLAQCTDCQVEIVYVPSFTDTAEGTKAADALIAKKCDVIFGAGGAMSSAGILHAAQQGTQVIGVDLDEFITTFQNGLEPGSDKLLTSAMKAVDEAVYDTIKAAFNNELDGGTRTYSAQNNGIKLAPFHKADALVPEDVKSLLQQTQQALADGTLDTGVDDAGNLKSTGGQ